MRHSLFNINVQVNFPYLVQSETAGISSMERLSPVVNSFFIGLGREKGEQERELKVGLQYLYRIQTQAKIQANYLALDQPGLNPFVSLAIGLWVTTRAV